MRKAIMCTVVLLLVGASISPKHFGKLGEMLEPISISKAIDTTICNMPTTSNSWCEEAGVSK
jgi:hypothetical protein